MEKINIEVNIDVAKIRQRILDKYKNDEFFLKEYQLYKKQFNNIDLVDLIEVIENKRKCLNCDGLDECKQVIKGHHLDLEIDTIKYCPCHYLNRINDLNKRYENLIYSTSPIRKELPDKADLDGSMTRLSIYEYIDLLEDNKVSQGLFLSGAPGVGKTFIIETLLTDYLAAGKSCAYILLNDFYSEMKSLYFSYDSDDKEMFNRLISRLKNVSVLIIDDIGAEKVDAISRDEILFPILDYRMKNDKLTHFTSNYSLDDLEHHYTETSAKVAEPVKAKRLIERIRVLSKEFKLDDEKSRR